MPDDSSLVIPHSSLVILSLLLFAATACERRPLELYNNGDVEVRFTYDWLSRFGEIPEGMTVILARDGDSVVRTEPFTTVRELTLRLQPGEYRMITFNQTFSEYNDNIRFVNRESHDLIYAKSFTWQQEAENQWDYQRIYLEEPHNIGVAIDTFVVPRTQDDIVFYPYRQHYEGSTLVIERPQTVLPMTTRLYVRVKVRGISYMSDVQGFVTGLADGFQLSHIWRSTNVGTIKLVSYSRSNVPGEANTAWLTFEVATFGLPHGRELLSQRTDNSNILMLCFTLVDDTRHYFSYSVGRNIRLMKDDEEQFTRDDVTTPQEIVIDYVTLPYAQPKGSGAFEAEVEDWIDTETIVIGF